MIFRIDRLLFTGQGVRHADLLALLRSAALRGHSILVVEQALGISTQDSGDIDQWAATLDTRLRAEVSWLRDRTRRIAHNSATRGAVTIAVVLEELPDHPPSSYIAMRLPQAIRLAAMPLLVLVENGLSDSAFIRRTMPPEWRAKLDEWEKLGTLRFEHGGGIGEMKRIVKHCSQEGAADPLGLGADAWRASHALMSDRDSPNQDGGISADVNALKRACDRAGMKERLHILGRRDQESYLPQEALQMVVDTKTSAADRATMQGLLAQHFQLGPRCRHSSLPRLGDSSWFKNAFLEHAAADWQDSWFEADGSAHEMIELAEMLAALT